MEIFLWILGIGIVLWFLHTGWDSSYNDMTDRINREADEQSRIREEEIQREAEIARQAQITEALSKAKYALIDDPRLGTVTWVGRGRKPKWLVDYLAEGGDLSDLEYPPKRVIKTEEFVITVNENLELSSGPHGNFVGKTIKDIKGNLWFDPDGTLYDYDGVATIPSEVLLALKVEGFDTQNMENNHVDTDS